VWHRAGKFYLYFAGAASSHNLAKKAPNYKNIIQGLNKPISRAYAKYA
jgi:hypothetical protein